MPSVTVPVTVNLSGSGSDPPAPPVLPVALAVVEIVLVAAAPPAPPLLEAVEAVVGSEPHAATMAPPREATRRIEERARVVTRPG